MKIYSKLIVIFILSISTCIVTYAQQEDFSGAQITLDKNSGVPINILFEGNAKPTVEAFFKIYKSVYNISDENKFIKFNSKVDSLGQISHCYKQYYKGIEIAGAQYILHEIDGVVNHAHGKLIHNLDLICKAKILESDALQCAFWCICAEQFLWKNCSYKDMLNDCVPEGKLLLSAGNKELCKENIKLVYRFDMDSVIPFGVHIVDVDANSGEIFNKQTLAY